jgi:hypothetical protein
MKNIVLSAIVVTALVTAGVGGTMAGFVDTEVSYGNFIQAGISDLLVNGENDPNIDAKIQFDHVTPSKSVDFWIDLYNWGKCQGGDIYMMFKDVQSVEAGFKNHYGINYVYDGVAPGSGSLPTGVPFGYRPPTGVDPVGAGVASSEPELGAEEGNFWIAQTYISSTDPAIMGVDYASGVAANTDVHVEIPLVGTAGNILGDPDTDDDGNVSAAEYAAWIVNGNRWQTVTAFSGKLADINFDKVFLGFLRTQEMTFVHVDVVINQLADPLYPFDYDQDGDIDAADDQLKWWPTNALQGDLATWAMMFELTTDP